MPFNKLMSLLGLFAAAFALAQALWHQNANLALAWACAAVWAGLYYSHPI
jgi:hypothetical protein